MPPKAQPGPREERETSLWGKCHHVIYNTESGSLLLDNEIRDQDWDLQNKAIGGV